MSHKGDTPMDQIRNFFSAEWNLIKNIFTGTPKFNLFGEILCNFNTVIMAFFAIIYIHQIVLIIISIFHKPKRYPITMKLHSYAYVIAARNEENVITNLIKSIYSQNYPKNKMKIFVVADNCTDQTAKVAREAGAIVYERFNTEKKGKSYAIDYLFKMIRLDGHDKEFDAYIMFDADNLLDENFTTEMNKVYEQGAKVVTSYRNSPNIGASLYAFGSGYSFLRECSLLHRSRALIGNSAYISGTGFLVDKSVIEKNDGWKYHLMIEDIEFSINFVMDGQKVYYNHNAIFYDEQPIKFKDSWNQRVRWVKGLYQCFDTYSWGLFKLLFKKNKDKKLKKFDIYETLLFTVPIPTFTIMWLVLFNAMMAINLAVGGCNLTYFMQTSVSASIDFFLSMYLFSVAMCMIITILDWKRLQCSNIKKLLMPFVFFFFLITYVPILLMVPFMKVEWKPILHRGSHFKKK